MAERRRNTSNGACARPYAVKDATGRRDDGPGKTLDRRQCGGGVRVGGGLSRERRWLVLGRRRIWLLGVVLGRRCGELFHKTRICCAILPATKHLESPVALRLVRRGRLCELPVLMWLAEVCCYL
mmetsp:Transcript_29242/g.49303  ORF Transcript_29242/g.49303 Transcript_29242/m.49303 type:complete len:125 (-) Transcript_29242:53-427(-)